MNQILFITDVGTMELLIIIIVLFLCFGPDKIPEIARALGEAVRKIRELTEDIKKNVISQSQVEKKIKEFKNSSKEVKKNINKLEGTIKRTK